MWKYEPDEDPKRRHHWKRDEPGHLQVGCQIVSKCPSNLSIADAERLLNDGIEYFPRRWTEDYPQRVYVVHAGCVYRATPTNPGVSYHGFPEMIERFPPDPDLRTRILAKAEDLGCGTEVRKWMHSKTTPVESR